MANTGNNRNGGSNRNSGRPTNSNSSAGKQAPAKGGSKPEGMPKETKETIAIVVFVVLMVYMTICCFIGKGDPAGKGNLNIYIGGFWFGLFGLLAYITPACIVASFFLLRKYRKNKDFVRRYASVVVIYFLVAIICEMVAPKSVLDAEVMPSYSFSQLYMNGYVERTGGGLISGTLAYIIHSWMTNIGLVILLIIGFFISLVVLTQGKLIVLLKKIFAGIVSLFNNAEGREIREARREEERRRANQDRNRRLLEDKSRHHEDDDVTDEDDDEDEDDTKLRNKKHIPTPGFNEGAEEQYYEEEADGESFEEYQNSEEKEQPRKIDNLTLRERHKRDKKNNRERNKEKKRLRAEQRETDAILKIVPPKDEQAVPTKYMQDMHEVFISDIEMYDEPAETAEYSGPHEYNNFEVDNDTKGKNDRSNALPLPPQKLPANKSRSKNAEYNGLEGSIAKNPLEKVKIPKQEINSVHRVVTSEDFDPMDADSRPYSDYEIKEDDILTNTVRTLDNIEADNDGKDTSELNSSDRADKITDYSEASSDAKETVKDYEELSDDATASVNAANDSDDEDDIPEDYYEPVKVASAHSDVHESNTGRNENASSKAGDDNDTANKSEAVPVSKPYQLPPLELLEKSKSSRQNDTGALLDTKNRLQETLNNFNVAAEVTEYTQGPSVTRFEITLSPGTKVQKILSLADDIKLSLASADIRIEAPIPGKSAVGIEVPNTESAGVKLRDLLEDEAYSQTKASLSFAVGKNIAGDVIVSDIAKMPHVLIAGTTGSGKSVCINTLIMSLLYKYTPDEVQMILVDPKVVELSVYNGIPHMPVDVITDPKKASAALAWGVKEMEERYKKFANLGVRDLKGYNDKIETLPDDKKAFKLPKIVIIIDELADLMMTCGKEVEASICRLAQLARACGIHLVVATQRPSVDVITGLIKANMPSRIAFAVKQGVDSRTILDQVGAEKLLGKGDMLFYPQGKAKPERVQGAFISDDEVLSVVDFIRNQRFHNSYADEANLDLNVADENGGVSEAGEKAAGQPDNGGNTRDELYADAGRCVITSGKGSIGFLQRKFQIGFNRAARIMDQLAEDNVVGNEAGTKAREILMSIEQFEAFLEENGIS